MFGIYSIVIHIASFAIITLMSGYKGHIAGGTVAGVAYAAVITSVVEVANFNVSFGLKDQWLFPAILVTLTILFGLWPDIDTNSKGQDIFFSGMFLLNLYLIYEKQYQLSAFLGLLAMLPILGKHRGWTHNRLFMFLIPLPILVVPYLASDVGSWSGAPYYGAAVVGIASHILLDGLMFRRFKIPKRF